MQLFQATFLLAAAVSVSTVVGQTNTVGNRFANYIDGENGMQEYTYSGENPNCQALGYSFGWKMDSCQARATSIQFDSLEKTGQGMICDPYDVGAFDLECSEDGIDATITPKDGDVIVKMKGGNGGTIYKTLLKGQSYVLDVGQRKQISHMEFCFKCEDSVVQNAVAITTEQPACAAGDFGTIDHDAADSVNELNIQVFTVNTGSHFELVVNDAPYAPEGGSIRIPAWCVDYSRGISGGRKYDMDVFSAFDPDVVALYGKSGTKTAAVDYPEKLPNLGWLINNINVGDHYDDGEGCAGTVDWNEFQVSLWYVIDIMNLQIYSYYNKNNRQDCISRGLAKMAEEQGNGWTPDCSKPGELVPLLFIADTDDDKITNQVLMGEVELASIEGMCKCEPDPRSLTDPPTVPKTPAPTDAPTNPPTNKPTNPPTDAPVATTPKAAVVTTTDDPMTTTSQPGTQGDPHFKTHGGEMYDFHGGCDLVLLDNPDFKDGLGMLVHIRTKIETWWSYVETSVLRIGKDDTIEISDRGILVNGVMVEQEQNKPILTKFAGLETRFIKIGNNYEAHIYLSGNEKLLMKTYKGFVKVQIAAEGSEHYKGSHGLLGNFPTGTRVGRDGVTLIEDVNVFGQEWQIREDEPKLFSSYDFDWVVPAGQKCAMPENSAAVSLLRKRRLADGMPVEQAEKACAHLQSADDRKACEFDVIATQDESMASVW